MQCTVMQYALRDAVSRYVCWATITGYRGNVEGVQPAFGMSTVTVQFTPGRNKHLLLLMLMLHRACSVRTQVRAAAETAT